MDSIPAQAAAVTKDGGKTAPSPSLLAYYRERIESFEVEREEYLKRLEVIEVSHAELHRTKWDLRVRQEEITELQNALSDANVHLFKEREQALQLLAENDQLKIQEIEDRRKIQHLLALTKPVAQEVTFYRDCRPSKVTKFSATQPLSSEQQNHKAGRNSKSLSKAVSGSGVGGDAIQGSRVLRTIYLPNERSDSLLKQVEALKAQLAEHEKLAKATIGALEKDRAEREAVKRQEAETFKQNVEALEKEKTALAETLRATTKDYLELRKEREIQKRTHLEGIEVLQQEKKGLQDKVEDLEEQVAVEATLVRESLEKENKSYNEQTKRRTAEREKQFTLLQRKHSCLSVATEKERHVLREKLENMKKKCKNLEHRRKMDLEGFARDIAQLRQQTRKCEVQVFGRGAQVNARAADPTVDSADRKTALQNQVIELRAKLTDLENEIQPVSTSRVKLKGRSRRKARK